MTIEQLKQRHPEAYEELMEGFRDEMMSDDPDEVVLGAMGATFSERDGRLHCTWDGNEAGYVYTGRDGWQPVP